MPTVSAEITAVSVCRLVVFRATAVRCFGHLASQQQRCGLSHSSERPVDTYWETGEDSPFDVMIEPNGSRLVGTAPKGRSFA